MSDSKLAMSIVEAQPRGGAIPYKRPVSPCEKADVSLVILKLVPHALGFVNIKAAISSLPFCLCYKVWICLLAKLVRKNTFFCFYPLVLGPLWSSVTALILYNLASLWSITPAHFNDFA